MDDVRVILQEFCEKDISQEVLFLYHQEIKELNGLVTTLNLSDVTNIGSHLIYTHTYCFPRFTSYPELDVSLFLLDRRSLG